MNNNSATFFAAICLFSILFTLIYLPTSNLSKPIVKPTPKASTYLNFESTQTLLTYFQNLGYLWPIKNSHSIPNFTLRSIPKDIGKIKDRLTRKTLFLRVMIPIIIAEQHQIRHKRKSLTLFLHSANLNPKFESRIKQLFKEYKINQSLTLDQKKAELLSRYDELPLTLVLAQAAIESGWGTSRFAREGNSLFGEWTFDGSGIIPTGREQGKSHRIKSFPSIQKSISSYIKNINRNNAYKELRQTRKKMRMNKQPLNARELANNLNRYSQKGQKYVTSILNILNSKAFKQIEILNL